MKTGCEAEDGCATRRTYTDPTTRKPPYIARGTNDDLKSDDHR